MLNEFVYCPRLCYLEFVQQEWDENVFTLDGSHKHRRVDREGGELPSHEEMQKELEKEFSIRSVDMSAPALGIITKMDLIEAERGYVTPIEYKRGPVPENPERSWDTDRVQLCAQALILRENGYKCLNGMIYYAQSHQRVSVLIDDALVQQTQDAIHAVRDLQRRETLPPPLIDSPKCPNCSLVGICLPDETLYTQAHANEPAEEDAVRRLMPARDDSIPLYVEEQGAYVGKKEETLVIRKNKEKLADARFIELSQLCLFGSVQVSTQAVQELMKRNIPIVYFTYGGWLIGLTQGLPHKNIELRRCQFNAADNKETCLAIAKKFILDKAANCRTMLRRNTKTDIQPALNELHRAEMAVGQTDSLESLLGVEGNAARVYFKHFSMLFSNEGGEDDSLFAFEHRNRRPPRDPVNALLSFAYALLTKDLTLTLTLVGFDPYLGFYHQPKYGRPALALDMMEPFRPIVADSVVMTCINTKVVTAEDFISRGGAVALKPGGRKRFIAAYERRMDTLVTHPVFNYRISYRRVLEVQCRLLGRYLLGELTEPPEFIIR
ncbi:CRISPR-associated endonuclease Cas1 [bacterium]|nr:CRISPR-associated endonuclease Cas1 [bacterium]